MTYTPTYPIQAVQHTRCILALTVARTVVDLFKPDEKCGKQLLSQMDKIDRWIGECSLRIQGRKLSAGARRDLDRSFTALEPYFEFDNLDDEALFKRWAALVWTALFFVWDVRHTCPDYRKPACWRFLDQTLTTLAEHLNTLTPDSDVVGSIIYEAAA